MIKKFHDVPFILFCVVFYEK